MQKTTKDRYGDTSFSPKRDWIGFCLIAVLMMMTVVAFAQQGSQGNTTIFAGAQMTFFGNHNFATGGAGVLAGIVNTERTTSPSGTGYGVLNYANASLVVTGANDANHVDGYVRNLGAGKFVYPVGDNGVYGPFAATAANTVGAYFHVNPSVAITSKPGGGDYPVLPSIGPFPSDSVTMAVNNVSTVEYWDIDGAAVSRITLSWNAQSNISAITGGSLSKLTIVGWSPSLGKWVKIPATIDAASIIDGGGATLTTGSITTNSSIIPNNFTVYTLAAQVPDLTPTTDIDELSFFTDGTSRDFIVNLYEIENVDATGQIRFRLTKLSAFTITYPTTNTVSNVFGGIANENANWTFTENTGFITVTSKPGVIIPAGGQALIGFNITRKQGTPPGNSQNITATIIGGSGGEVNTTNNQVVTTVTAQ